MRRVFHPTVKAEDVAPGTGLAVQAGSEDDCVVFRTEDGSCFAIGRLCPHQNEPLDMGRLEGCEAVCRRHHLRFDVRTGECTNAGGYAIRTYPVEVREGRVYVGIWEE